MPKALVMVRPDDKVDVKRLKNALEYHNLYRNNLNRNYGNHFIDNYGTKFGKNFPPAPPVESKKQETRPKEVPKSSVREILQEYTESSSVHGVQYLGRHPIRKTAFEKFVWICVMIAGFVCLSLLVKQFWLRYETNPTSTYVTTFYAPIFASPYPAVTICPFTPTPTNTMQSVLKNLKIPPDMTLDDVSFFVAYANHLASPINLESQKYWRQFSSLLKYNNLQLMEFVRLTRSCEDMIDFVLWNGNPVDLAQNFRLSYSSKGLCCSFNYLLEGYMKQGKTSPKPKLLHADQFGSDSGLFVVFKRQLFPEEDSSNFQRITTESMGIAIYVHHSMEYPGTSFPSYILQQGHELQLSVEPSFNLKPINFRRPDNTKECTAEDEGHLTYYPDYRYPNCFAECRIKAGLQLCGCVLSNFYQPVIETHSLTACVPEDFPCWRTHGKSIRIVKDLNLPNFTCICRNKCKSAKYKARPTLVRIDNVYMSSSVEYQNISMDQAVLKVYFSSQVYMHWETTPAATELNLLSSLGGIFSLFLGCSFLSAVEILYFLCYIIAFVATYD